MTRFIYQLSVKMCDYNGRRQSLFSTEAGWRKKFLLTDIDSGHFNGKFLVLYEHVHVYAKHIHKRLTIPEMKEVWREKKKKTEKKRKMSVMKDLSKFEFVDTYISRYTNTNTHSEIHRQLFWSSQATDSISEIWI